MNAPAGKDATGGATVSRSIILSLWGENDRPIPALQGCNAVGMLAR